MPVLSRPFTPQPAQQLEGVSTYSEALGASIDETLATGTTAGAVNALKLWGSENLGFNESPFPQFGPTASQFGFGAKAPLVTNENAKQKVKDAGLEGQVPLDKYPDGIRSTTLDMLISLNKDKVRRQTLASQYDGWSPQVAGMLIGSVIDPANVALSFVPVVGEARYAKLLSDAGGAVGRFGVRAGVGAAEGLVGSVLAEPLIYAGQQQWRNDYDAYDSFLNVAGGAVFGSLLHAGVGLARDAFGNPKPLIDAKPMEVAPDEAVEPAVPSGMVRVYHSGSSGGGVNAGDSGRWVSTSRKYASDYRSDLPLFYLDLPESDPRINNPDYNDQGVKQGFTFNFETTPEEAAKLKKISRNGKSAVPPGAVDLRPMPEVRAVSPIDIPEPRAVPDEFVATSPKGQWRLRDTEAPAGTDFSEFGQVRQVEAFDGDTLIGKLVYANDGTPPTVEVDPAYRGKDVATAMYKLAEERGGVLGAREGGIRGRADEYRTPAGQAFRAKMDPARVSLMPRMEVQTKGPYSERLASALEPAPAERAFVASLDHDTQAAALRQAVAQAIDGRPIDVTPAMLSDPQFRGSPTAYSEALNRAKLNTTQVDGANLRASNEAEARVSESEGEALATAKALLDEDKQQLQSRGVESEPVEDDLKISNDAVKAATMCLMRANG